MKNEDNQVLLIDEEFSPILIEEECADIKPIMKDFMRCYIDNRDKPVEEWLEPKMQEQLPEKKPEEIRSMTKEIITTIKVNEEKRVSLEKAIQNGRSKESWFAQEAKKATSAMAAQEAGKYLKELDGALQTANDSLYRTIATQAGTINQNPSLDGFIAEQYHAQTFNLNAQASGSEYRAEVLKPEGTGYAKNSVDIVIRDNYGEGKIVNRYQSKYCRTAKATEEAFADGDYRGQQKLVPAEQQAEIQKKSTTVLEAPDGTTSNPLTKAKAEQMRDEAQSGQWNELNWNEYKTKDLAMGIGKQAGYAALQGAAIGVGAEVAQKLWNGEEIDGAEVVETALKSGADFGIKAASAGALKVGVEKGIIGVIPKGTPASTITNIAHVAVENVKVLGKMATGELTPKEGLEKMTETTVSTAAGLMAMGKGAAIGTGIGMVFGPVGAGIGGFIGGTIGYMAGSKVGQAVVKGARKIGEGAKKVVKTITSIASEAMTTVKSVGSEIKSFIKGIFGF